MKNILLLLTVSLLLHINCNATPTQHPFSGTKIAAPLLLSPADKATGVSVFPEFTWSAPDGATSYRLEIGYTKDCKNFALTLQDSSYTFDSQLQLNKQVFWRVRVENYNGYYITDTSDWSAVFSFTTVDAPLNPPIIRKPEMSYSIPRNVTFSWDKIDSAQYYHFQIARDEAFSNIVLDTNITKCELKYTLNYKSYYYYRANANNQKGMSPWSKTRWCLICRQFDSPPGPDEPSDNSIKIPVAGAFKWHSYYGGDCFQVQLSKDNNFTTTVLDTITKDLKCNYVNLDYGSYYYWHVKAYSDYDTSEWSETYHFRTEYEKLPGVPEEVTLLTPKNNANYTFSIESGDINVYGDDFTWKPGPTQVDKYFFEIANNENFTDSHINDDITETTLNSWTAILGSTSEGDYYWRVKAGNEAGWGQFSEVRRFHLNTVGVKESLNADDQDIRIVPNPADGHITVSLKDTGLQVHGISIFNSLGMEIKRYESSDLSGGNSVSFSTGELAAGVYYCTVEYAATIKQSAFLIVR